MGVCTNRDVRHTKETVLNHFRDFEAIEVLLSHLQTNSLQCIFDTLCRERTENSYLHLLGHEKKVPAGGVNLAIKGKAIESRDHTPVPKGWRYTGARTVSTGQLALHTIS